MVLNVGKGAEVTMALCELAITREEMRTVLLASHHITIDAGRVCRAKIYLLGHMGSYRWLVTLIQST